MLPTPLTLANNFLTKVTKVAPRINGVKTRDNNRLEERKTLWENPFTPLSTPSWLIQKTWVALNPSSILRHAILLFSRDFHDVWYEIPTAIQAGYNLLFVSFLPTKQGHYALWRSQTGKIPLDPTKDDRTLAPFIYYIPPWNHQEFQRCVTWLKWDTLNKIMNNIIIDKKILRIRKKLTQISLRKKKNIVKMKHKFRTGNPRNISRNAF